jgi:hypothetical protein
LSFDGIWAIALAWPEVEDGTSYGRRRSRCARSCWRASRKTTTLVMLGVPQEERAMLCESEPRVFYFTDHYRDYPTVLIRLSKATRSHIEPLLCRRWRELASKAAVKKFYADAR